MPDLPALDQPPAVRHRKDVGAKLTTSAEQHLVLEESVPEGIHGVN